MAKNNNLFSSKVLNNCRSTNNRATSRETFNTKAAAPLVRGRRG